MRSRHARPLRPPVRLGRVACFVSVAVVLAAGCSDGSTSTTSRQDEIEARGTEVMPFDQRRTTHVFRNTDDGGTQQVVAKSAIDSEQVSLVRQHLRKEAARFKAGNFSDPMAIHGMKMPGLDVLRDGAGRVRVTYTTVPHGAQITYTSTEPELVDALHQWFDAQLMDHGSNAHS